MTEAQFGELVKHIKHSHNEVIRSVNVNLINLYWQVGEYIHNKMKTSAWGEKTIRELADYIAENHPELKGFNRPGLYRMRLFYKMYYQDIDSYKLSDKVMHSDNQPDIIVSTALRQFSDIRNTMLVKVTWSHHLVLMGLKYSDEIKFYLELAIRENYTVRELERQHKAALFERYKVGQYTIPDAVKNHHADTSSAFKDSYVFEFLNLPESFKERDLQAALNERIKAFVLELGKDFIFMEENYRVQVGNVDFFIDLLFYHRKLHCMVAFELKTGEFKPEYLKKLSFYLEALDRDVKYDEEKPSVGVLLCQEKNSQIVEYSINRELSPILIAEYQTFLPNKEMLRKKFTELFQNEKTE
ncbi:Predicted nuclease of restriction endonuclease-like (RecB) superfamily, DUF1016 family [Chitinophaga jiangningensis]|uniref:Predicted nuclease of restriction endonuclease-like (RecB) superfamily, DUF1016 family n=1 Tax=Chitinophaga jiangningensis TaxID=1419482 RepID=A0A1M6WZV4_9BACT|nr:PDDEXK nuclease domain-containing protein [Chitinophaga jiangningensis]SHK99280.1 Predicted nuclease of restriction endonuclease-like (RecB) superfamily, DUF1016 family [Chitinophaga jiangningensis]